MLIVPIADTYSQTSQVVLGGQACTIAIYQKTTGLFLDLSVADVLVIGGVLCLNRNRIVRDAYLGFIGDLAFYDVRNLADPSSPGLGTRFLLAYLEASDL